MTTNKALIERLREMPVLLDKAPVMYARTAYDQCLKAADALEAQDKEIADLHKQLSLARRRKESARIEVNRAMDKLKDDNQ